MSDILTAGKLNKIVKDGYVSYFDTDNVIVKMKNYGPSAYYHYYFEGDVIFDYILKRYLVHQRFAFYKIPPKSFPNLDYTKKKPVKVFSKVPSVNPETGEVKPAGWQTFSDSRGGTSMYKFYKLLKYLEKFPKVKSTEKDFKTRSVQREFTANVIELNPPKFKISDGVFLGGNYKGAFDNIINVLGGASHHTIVPPFYSFLDLLKYVKSIIDKTGGLSSDYVDSPTTPVFPSKKVMVPV